MNVCVIGLGYVGLTTATCLAHSGNMVIGVDIDSSKIQLLTDGVVPIREPHLQELFSQCVARGRFQVTTDLEGAVRPAHVVFLCVGTPPSPNGDANLSSITSVVDRIREAGVANKVIVTKSTVRAKSGSWIETKVNAGEPRGISVASNPEFLKESSAVEDFFHPDRIVVGVESSESERMLRSLYEPFVNGIRDCPRSLIGPEYADRASV